MNDTPNFDSILDAPASSVEKPKPYPIGTYFWMVSGMPDHGKSTRKKTPFVEFKLKCTAIGEDVDETDFNTWATRADGTVKQASDITTKLTFYTTPDALWRLTEFLEHLGIDEDGKSIRAMLDETPNCAVGGHINHEASEDGSTVFAKIDKTFPVE